MHPPDHTRSVVSGRPRRLGTRRDVTRVWRTGIALAAGAVLTLAACGDDGNDRAGAQERAERLAAEARATDSATAERSVPTTSPLEDGAATVATDSTVPPIATTTASTVAPTGVVVPVVAIDNIFRPEVLTIGVGDEVLWENRGMNDHDVLYVDGDEWGVEVEGFTPGAVYAHVFTEPGEYRYYCSIHGNETVGMVGTILVEG